MEDEFGMLAQKVCVPCKGGMPSLQGAELNKLGRVLGHDWKIVDGHHLEKNFTFPNFQSALEFTVKIGAVAEAENHHPDIALAWGKVGVTLWTHKINGLTESDFVLAAKIERANV